MDPRFFLKLVTNNNRNINSFQAAKTFYLHVLGFCLGASRNRRFRNLRKRRNGKAIESNRVSRTADAIAIQTPPLTLQWRAVRGVAVMEVFVICLGAIPVALFILAIVIRPQASPRRSHGST
jgi:hypothetical protein